MDVYDIKYKIEGMFSTAGQLFINSDDFTERKYKNAIAAMWRGQLSPLLTTAECYDYKLLLFPILI